MWKLVVSLAICALGACSLNACSSEREPKLESTEPVRTSLAQVDLSASAVAAMSLADLWQIGVRQLGWPTTVPGDVTKDEVHQRLLHEKYRGVGDFFHEGYDGGVDAPDAE